MVNFTQDDKRMIGLRILPTQIPPYQIYFFDIDAFPFYLKKGGKYKKQKTR